MEPSLFFLIVSLALHVIGITTSHWSSSATANYGIWKACFNVDQVHIGCFSYDYIYSLESPPEYLAVTQVISVCAVLFLAMGVTIETICTTLLSKEKHEIVFVMAAVATFLGAMDIFLTVGLWGWVINSDMNVDSFFGWSQILSAVGGNLSAIAGVLMVIDIYKFATAKEDSEQLKLNVC